MKDLVFVSVGGRGDDFESLADVSAYLKPDDSISYVIGQNIQSIHAYILIDFIKHELCFNVYHPADFATLKDGAKRPQSLPSVEFNKSSKLSPLLSLEKRLLSTRNNLQEILNQEKQEKSEIQVAYEKLDKKSKQYNELANELECILEKVNAPLLVIGRNMRVSRFVQSLAQLANIDTLQIHQPIQTIQWHLDMKNIESNIKSVIEKQQSHQEIVTLHDKKWHLQITPYINKGRGFGAIMIFFDVTELITAQTRIRKEKEWNEITLQSIADGVIRADTQGVIEYINPAAETLLGCSEIEVIGQPLNEVLKFLGMPEEGMNIALLHLQGGSLAGYSCFASKEHIYAVIGKMGRIAYVNYTISTTTDDNGVPNGTVVTLHDVTEYQNHLNEMAWISSHDHLTEILNRREMESRISAAIKAIKQGVMVVAVFLYMDLDQFKVVNDICGHLAGDELLKQISRILNSKVREGDLLGRLGGDEFGLLLENCSIDKASALAEDIRAEVERFRFSWGGRVFRIGVSIGVVEVNAQTRSVEDVLANSDNACYAAKDLGRDRIHVFRLDDKLLGQQRSDLSWVARIQAAIDENRLALFAQKISHLKGQANDHWEVLLRMHSPEGELIAPGAFLPAAERYGMMQRIDEWVVRHVFSILREYALSNKGSVPYININVSGLSFSDDRVARHIRKGLIDYEIDPEKVVFEITESSAIASFSTAIKFIEEVRALGCKVALDDFGTGVSSFSYLQKLRVDYIKIDGDFIKDLDSNIFNEKVVSSIVDISSHLGIAVVAEYVESEAIKEKLLNLGVDWVQGYAIAKPVPLSQLIA